MSVHRATIGDCPRCDTPISDDRVLIEYETETGRDCFADCPGCREVVHPE